jgi:hypothetical protein
VDPGYSIPLPDNPAAYSALTASSVLRHLNISAWTLPVAGVWQHVFPAGRQLPHLQSLVFAAVKQPAGSPATALDSTRLVSCCPGLQSLDMRVAQCSSELLAALPGLSVLHTLQFFVCPTSDFSTAEIVGLISQLTGLRELIISCRSSAQLCGAGASPRP